MFLVGSCSFLAKTAFRVREAGECADAQRAGPWVAEGPPAGYVLYPAGGLFLTSVVAGRQAIAQQHGVDIGQEVYNLGSTCFREGVGRSVRLFLPKFPCPYRPYRRGSLPKALEIVLQPGGIGVGRMVRERLPEFADEQRFARRVFGAGRIRQPLGGQTRPG